MGWFSDAVDAVSDAADAVGDFVEDVVEEVGEAIGDAVEAVGDAIDDGLNWVGDQIGGFVGDVIGWVGGIINAAFNFVGSVIKAVFGIVGNIIGGIIKIIGGLITLNGGLILEGLGDIFSSIIGGVILVLGKAVAFVQVIFTLGRERKLTEKEIIQLKRAFKDSLNYYIIRVSTGHAGIFQIGNNRFALGNVIYFKKQSVEIEWLVHETVHVWQYQNGGARYITDNIYAQMTESNFNDPDVYVTEINEGKNDWENFHPEAQAELIEGIWIEGELHNSDVKTGNGYFFDADNKSTFGKFAHNSTDYTDIANRATKSLRDGRTPSIFPWN